MEQQDPLEPPVLRFAHVDRRRCRFGPSEGGGHRALLEEHLSIQGREKFYETLEEMQKDLKDTRSATIPNGLVKAST